MPEVETTKHDICSDDKWLRWCPMVHLPATQILGMKALTSTKTGCCHVLHICVDRPAHHTSLMMIISRRWRRQRLHFLWTGHNYLGALDDRVKHILKKNYEGIIFSNTDKIWKCSFSVNWRKNHRYWRLIQSCSRRFRVRARLDLSIWARFLVCRALPFEARLLVTW